MAGTRKTERRKWRGLEVIKLPVYLEVALVPYQQIVKGEMGSAGQ
jgi:hypothetical protein